MEGDDDKAKALRAKRTAENRIRSQDYCSARTLIQEAMQIFPSLELASEMRTVCEILSSTEIELQGCGIDWYLVLRLDPSDQTPAIVAEYQKLTSLLEPIKNDFLGTELALKLVRDAYSVLSDPVKRAGFDSKRNVVGGICSGSNSPVLGNGGFYDAGKEAVMESTVAERPRRSALEDCGGNGDEKQKKIFNSNSQVQCSSDALNVGNGVTVERIVAGNGFDMPSSSRPKRPALEACGGSGESVLLTENCAKKNCAQEASWVTGHPQLAACKRPEPEFYDFKNNTKSEVFSKGQVWVLYDHENIPRRYGRIDRIIPHEFVLSVTWFKPCPTSLHERKWCDMGLPVACGSFVPAMNKISLCWRWMFSHLFRGIAKESFEVYPRKGEVWAIYRDWDIEWCSDPGMRKKCGFVIVEILTDYLKDSGVKVAYLVKVDGFRNVFQRHSKRGNDLSFQIPNNKHFMFSHNVPAFRFVGGEMVGIVKGMLELDPLATPVDLVQDFASASVAFVDISSRSSEEANCSDEGSFTHLSNPSMNTTGTGVSNPGIHSHNLKWSAKDFSAEQIWAVYDGPDGMPRSYVKVNAVVSPNKVSVTFLEPHPMLDEEIQWVEENLPFVCGIFRAGRATSILEMTKFSLLVKCDRSTKKSFYRIFPRKGEIWAMYKNWKSSWKNSDHVRYQWRIVEILSEFSDETGISICSLIEVKGRLTFFQRQLHEEFQLTRQLSRLETLTFSHRVPAFTVLGNKDRDIPEGSWHLEPDALPLKFIN